MEQNMRLVSLIFGIIIVVMNANVAAYEEPLQTPQVSDFDTSFAKDSYLSVSKTSVNACNDRRSTSHSWSLSRMPCDAFGDEDVVEQEDFQRDMAIRLDSELHQNEEYRGRSIPIPIVSRSFFATDEVLPDFESLPEFSLPSNPYCHLNYSDFSQDVRSQSPTSDNDLGLEDFQRRGAHGLATSDFDEEFFSCPYPFVRVDSQQSQQCQATDGAEESFRCNVTVTFTGTNEVKRVPFGSFQSVNGCSKKLMNGTQSMSPTPINMVQRVGRPSLRTDAGRLREAQNNCLYPIQFGQNPITREECIVLAPRREESIIYFRPMQSMDFASTPYPAASAQTTQSTMDFQRAQKELAT